MIVMSQLISELTHHDGRGKITTLLGIDIDEFDTTLDNDAVIKHNISKIIMLNNMIFESNSTVTKGIAECKFINRFLFSQCISVKVEYIHV